VGLGFLVKYVTSSVGSKSAENKETLTMGLFQNIKNGLYRFMYGRNGVDQLNTALLRLYLVLFVVQLVLSALGKALAASICGVVMWALMLLLLFRMFSKNLYKRREENQKWVNWRWKLKSRSAGAKARHADKEHKYFTCKQCKTICRVPTGKGKIIITCPKCGTQIDAKT
jgi:hypothetical protein